MPDLRHRFSTLDRIEVPDLRGDIRNRKGGQHRGEVPWGRLGTAAVALAVAAAGTYVVTRTFLDRSRERAAGAPPPGRIAFVVRTEGPDMIHLTNTGGSGTRPLIQGRDPAWSPDGTRLAFRRGAGPQAHIGVVDADGTDAQVLHTVAGEPKAAGPPVWSPEGERLAFAAGDGIYVMSADGSDPRRISQYQGAHACYDLEPSWSPDGQRIAFAVRCEGGDLGIFVMGADGSARTRLTGREAGPDSYPPYGDIYPVWSPEGGRLAFIRRTGPPDYRSDLYLMDADGTGLRRITDRGRFDHRPDWSPEGTHMAVSDPAEGDLYVVDAETGTLTRLDDGSAQACCPSWQPAVPDALLTPTPDATPTQGAIVRGSTVTIPLGDQPVAIAAADGVVWISLSNRRLVRIDQATNEVVATISLPRPAWELAAAPGAVWAHGYVRRGPDVLLRIDPETNRVSSEIQLDDYVGPLVADAEGVWVMTTDEGEDPGGQDDRRRLLRIEAATNEITVSTPVDGYVDEMGLAEGSVWLMHWEAGPGGNERCGQVSRVDASTGEIMESIPADGLNLAAGPGAVWTSCRVDPEGFFVARRVDPATSGVSDPIPLSGGYGPIGVVEGGVWFSGYDDQGRVRVFFMDEDTYEISGAIRLRAGYYTGATFDPETSTIWISHTRVGGSAVRVDLG